MKIVHSDKTEKFKHGKNCVAIEYPSNDKDINGAIIKLTGRYPSQGRVVNLKCKELCYVVKGSGKIVVNNQETNIVQGDLILIKPKEKYFWDGKLTILISSSPAWSLAQYKEVK